MSLNLASKPLLVCLHAHGLMQAVARTEQQTGIDLDINSILEEIVQCVVDKQTAQIELELYALDIMDKHAQTCSDRDCRAIVKLFVKLGMLLLEELSIHGLYRNQKLDFMYSNRVLDNLIFMEITSDTVRMLNYELNPPVHKPSRPVSIPAGASILPRYV